MNNKILIWIVAFLSVSLTASTQTPFELKLQEKGIEKGLQNDWSDATSIKIPEPVCAYINITGTDHMPARKTDELLAWMEVYDGHNNYFCKQVQMSAQGNSSLGFVKKNFKVDFSFGDELDATITIGDWVKQDAFHFKAYYTDYFRGIGCVGYQIFHQMQADRGAMWERAAIADPNPKARCYPDGFPCLVYLNGNFYGIYAWQLKKDRKNMNQQKDVAEHIHLDGKFDNTIFWCSQIDWTQFEVRNPKGLYCMDGTPYDGDHPAELMDETSPYYDLPEDAKEVKEGKKRSAQVKQYVTAFSKFYIRLTTMEQNGSTTDAIREELQNFLDIPSFIDYLCFAYYVNNYDGFWKNWQWFTYDGIKWFVAPYDLDCTFGNHSTGNFIIPPEWNYEYGDYSFIFNLSRMPTGYVRKYFWKDIKERYTSLRELQVFSPDNIKALLTNWYNRVGTEAYALEWEKWPDSKCIGQTTCTAPWTTTNNWTDYGTIPDYHNDSIYHMGDKCRLACRIWTATETTQGITPYSQLGYTDTLERVYTWADNRTRIIDEYLDYPTLSVGVALQNMIPIQKHISHNLSGQQLLYPQKGINIINGKKILVK